MYPIQPDINNDTNSVTPADNSLIERDRSIRRRQTIDTVQAREYAARHRRHQQHQTPLKQLQALFKPNRQIQTTVINNDEQLSMINKNQTSAFVQRSASVRERSLYEGKKPLHHRHH